MSDWLHGTDSLFRPDPNIVDFNITSATPTNMPRSGPGAGQSEEEKRKKLKKSVMKKGQTQGQEEDHKRRLEFKTEYNSIIYWHRQPRAEALVLRYKD